MPRFSASARGVGERSRRRVARGHRHAQHVLGPERARREAGDQRRVDAAREARAARARSRSGARSRACRAPAPPAPSARPSCSNAPQLARRRAPLDVDDDQIGRVLGGARDDLAARVERQAGAVEDQIVLAADLVDEQQRPAPAPRRRRQHARAQVALLDGERRGREVEDDLGAGARPAPRSGRRGRAARGQKSASFQMSSQIEMPSCGPRKATGDDLGGRLEVAPLVEDVVGRQQRLARDVR